jgi:L-2-hydroxyglutarate oxidase LhgO
MVDLFTIEVVKAQLVPIGADTRSISIHIIRVILNDANVGRNRDTTIEKRGMALAVAGERAYRSYVSRQRMLCSDRNFCPVVRFLRKARNATNPMPMAGRRGQCYRRTTTSADYSVRFLE